MQQSQRNAWILDWKHDQVLPHDFHMIFRDTQITCKNEVKEFTDSRSDHAGPCLVPKQKAHSFDMDNALFTSTKHKTMTCALPTY
jgi:hypothetical protein